MVERFRNKPHLLFPLFTFLLLIGVILLTVSQTLQRQSNNSHAQSVPTDCSAPSILLPQSAAELSLFNQLNAYRQQQGKPALNWSQGLKKPSAWMAVDAANHQSISHTDSLGRTAQDRLTACGYNYSAMAENIFEGSTDPTDAINWWKNSPPHNANMLSTAVTEAAATMYNSYWILDFGTPSSLQTSPTGSISLTPSTTLNPTGTTPEQITPSSSIPQSPNPTISVNPSTDMKLDVSIKLPGVGLGGNKNPKHKTRQVLISVFDTSNKQIVTGKGFLAYNGKSFEGVIHLGAIANGIYYIKVLSDNTLSRLVLPQFQTLKGDQVNALPEVILPQGDFNSDNVIDINDYNLALTCFQNSACPTKNQIDLNDDGVANVIDYNLLLSAFSRYKGD